MDAPISLEFFGHAEPAGSKQPFVPLHPKTKQPYRRKGGGVVVSTVDDNPKAKGWKEAVAQAAGEQYDGPLLTGALVVECIFYRVRPAGHFGTGRNAGIVKNSAPGKPIVRPDLLKTMRAIEDALTGVVWRDDAQIVDEHIGKRYGDRERVEMNVWVDEAQLVGDLVAAGVLVPSDPRETFEQLALVAA